MQDTPDWKERAEAEYKKEREGIRADVKVGFYLLLFVYIFLGVVFGAIYVVKWMIVGGDFLPSNHDAVWIIAIVVGGIPFSYVLEWQDRKREVREQRLIRLEMKIDVLLDRQKQ
jgi:hypothetical protein